MAQSSRRRKRASGAASTGAGALVFLLMVAAAVGGFYFLWPALTSGDLYWWSTEFDARPIKLEVVSPGRRETISPDDARFLPLVEAFNATIERGYRLSSAGVSEATWLQIDEHGVMVETTYAQPIKLHLRGGFEPTQRLMILLSDGELYLDGSLFRDHGQQNGAIPVQLEDPSPLRDELAGVGYTFN